MQPESPRDFLRVAQQRLEAAELIFRLTPLNLEAQYIGGYAIECSFKALILENTPIMQRIDMLHRITRGAANHRADVLVGKLRELGVSLTSDLAVRVRRFQDQWDSSLRYETGRRDTGETRGLLRTARTIHQWAEGQIP